MTGLDTIIRHLLPVVLVPDDQLTDRSQTQTSAGWDTGCVAHCWTLPKVRLGLQPLGQLPWAGFHLGVSPITVGFPLPSPPWKAA